MRLYKCPAVRRRKIGSAAVGHHPCDFCQVKELGISVADVLDDVIADYQVETARIEGSSSGERAEVIAFLGDALIIHVHRVNFTTRICQVRVVRDHARTTAYFKNA